MITYNYINYQKILLFYCKFNFSSYHEQPNPKAVMTKTQIKTTGGLNTCY